MAGHYHFGRSLLQELALFTVQDILGPLVIEYHPLVTTAILRSMRSIFTRYVVPPLIYLPFSLLNSFVRIAIFQLPSLRDASITVVEQAFQQTMEERLARPFEEQEIARLLRFSHEPRGSNELACAICLYNVEPGAEIIQLRCLHKFHSDCIISWFRMRAVCPICRGYARLYAFV